MQVVFRTDASIEIGSGHVVRCTTLAGVLRQSGARILFVCNRVAGNMIGWLEAQGFAVAALDDVSLVNDAAATKSALVGAGFDHVHWLVVDHYQLDRVWEQELRPVANRIAVIDDMADRSHDCDLLLDQNLVADMELRYAKLIDPGTVTLLGPRYALLQPSYAQAHRRARPRQGPPQRVLLYFGASDLPNLTARILAALVQQQQDFSIDVVVGALSAHRAEIVSLARLDPRVSIHEQQPSLVELMEQADLAIGAGGATSWERLCLGLPSLVITLAENQEPIATELDRRNLVRLLGRSREIADDRLNALLRAALAASSEPWFDGTAASIVDGLGALRVAATMAPTGLAAESLTCRPVTGADEELLLTWANDPTTRATAFDPRPIAAEAHHSWLARRLVEPHRFRLFILGWTAGVDVGQVRFERDDRDHWVISYSVARELRGLKLAAPMLERALSELSALVGTLTVVGRVLSDNIASRRVFERLRFTSVEIDHKTVEFRRHL